MSLYGSALEQSVFLCLFLCRQHIDLIGLFALAVELLRNYLPLGAEFNLPSDLETAS
jgi:hypothetical protein